jgi:hypothetical protein
VAAVHHQHQALPSRRERFARDAADQVEIPRIRPRCAITLDRLLG